MCGEFLLIMSLIVLGGNFRDKIRALFIYDAKVKFGIDENCEEYRVKGWKLFFSLFYSL